MPGLFFEPCDRRRFLTATALGTAALSVGCRTAQKRTLSDTLHMALLSDTHVPANRKELYTRGATTFLPWDNLQRVVAEVAATRPEAVILNGDAARQEGLPADYQEVRSLLEPV